MLHIFISIIGILFTIFFVIGTHEAAHFMTARLLGVKVLVFSIGFGKKLWHWYDKSGTEYRIALIPLGGYVKMLDEHEGEVPAQQLHLAFNRQPFYKKFLIVLAGPVMNLLCAVLLYWCIFIIGFTTLKPIIGEVSQGSIAAASGLHANQQIIRINDRPTATWSRIIFELLTFIGTKEKINLTVQSTLAPYTITTHRLDLSEWQLSPLKPDALNSLGIIPYQPPIPLIVAFIAPASPAATSFKTGDKLLQLDGKPIANWQTLFNFIQQHPGKKATFTLLRDNRTINITVQIGEKRALFGHPQGFLGIGPRFEWPLKLLHKIQYSPLAAIPQAFKEVYDFTYFNLLLFGKMLTGKISLQSLGGPITIFESAGNAINYGIIAFLGFLAFLSISIGIINLLPIPGLDGGHLLLQLIEACIRRPIPESLLLYLYRFGFLLLFFVLLQALINDLLRL